MQEIKLFVQNMKCSGCTSSISKVLSKIEGIANINIDLDHNFIELSCERTNNIDEVKSSLRSMGYVCSEDKNSLADKANSYVHCMIGKIVNLKNSNL